VAKKEPKAMPFEYGAPPMPKGLPRATRNAWNRLIAELLPSRKLAQSDTSLLLSLIQARADRINYEGKRRPVYELRNLRQVTDEEWENR